jgi:hypothetical protein
VKLDGTGHEEWSRMFTGEELPEPLSDSWIYGGQQTTDGGYIAVGYAAPYFKAAVYLVKVDAAGSHEWSRSIAPISWSYYHAYAVQQTAEGGYIIAGTNGDTDESVAFLVKTDGNGNELWARTYGDDYEIGRSVRQTSDGGYILVGSTRSYGAGDFDVYLVRTDPAGGAMWSRTFGGAGRDYGESVRQTTDGGYIVAGTTESFGADSTDMYLIRTDEHGHGIWTRTFGGAHGDEASAVRQTGDGGFMIAGSTASMGTGESDVFLVKTDSEGHEVWSAALGGNGREKGSSVEETADGACVVAGTTRGPGDSDNTSFYVVKLGPEGWEAPFTRGDANADGNSLDLGDAIYILQFLFSNGPEPPCLKAADANDDNKAIDIGDGVYILQHLFASGPALPAPSASCGLDATEDALTCTSFGPCQ